MIKLKKDTFDESYTLTDSHIGFLLFAHTKIKDQNGKPVFGEWEIAFQTGYELSRAELDEAGSTNYILRMEIIIDGQEYNFSVRRKNDIVIRQSIDHPTEIPRISESRDLKIRITTERVIYTEGDRQIANLKEFCRDFELALQNPLKYLEVEKRDNGLNIPQQSLFMNLLSDFWHLLALIGIIFLWWLFY